MDLVLNCPHCGTTGAGFTGVHSRQREDETRRPVWDVFAYCRVCQAGIVLVVRSAQGYNPLASEWRSRRTTFSIERVHPAPATEVAPKYTPDPIAKDFKEGLRCLRRGDFNAAGMVFRKALQRATTALAKAHSMDPFESKTTLHRRINALAKDGHLTDSMRDLATAIRLDGNEAAHEEDQDFDKDAATQIQEFTELFLIYAFNLPERVKLASQSRTAPASPKP